mmetsp:Transcript_24131/g.29711  ORF Transcript_24131/g.29711 Transcript_24131/m.29711 type:complete len:256 (-) Transcript_24131:96-863(-)
MTSKFAIVHKPTKDTKVGIDFIAINGKLYVAYLSGLFASTCAEIGDEVISLNNKRVTIKSTEDDLKGQIRSLKLDVALELVTKPKIFMHTQDKGKTYFMCHHFTMPPLLKDKKVPLEIWNKLISYTNLMLLPKTQVAEKYRLGVQQMYDNFVTRNFAKQGFAEAETTLKMHKAHMSAGTAHVNASLAASNLLAMAGAMLMPYGIIPQILIRNEKPFVANGRSKVEGVVNRFGGIMILFKETEFSLPIGLEFHLAE